MACPPSYINLRPLVLNECNKTCKNISQSWRKDLIKLAKELERIARNDILCRTKQYPNVMSHRKYKCAIGYYAVITAVGTARVDLDSQWREM